MTVDALPLPVERRSVSPTPAPEVATDDARWAAAARDGDRVAFARLHKRYAGLVHGVLLSRAPARDADDLVQDVFATALERIGKLRDPSSFGAWIAQIARNRATDHLRRQGLRQSDPLPDEDALRARGISAEQRASAVEALAAIRALPEAYRETLVLRLVEGLSGPEIAEKTGLTPGSVRVNLHRGMRLLRERLGQEVKR